MIREFVTGKGHWNFIMKKKKNGKNKQYKKERERERDRNLQKLIFFEGENTWTSISLTKWKIIFILLWPIWLQRENRNNSTQTVEKKKKKCHIKCREKSEFVIWWICVNRTRSEHWKGNTSHLFCFVLSVIFSSSFILLFLSLYVICVEGRKSRAFTCVCLVCVSVCVWMSGCC